MSVRSHSIYFLTCDACGVEFVNPRPMLSAMEVRIAAGIAGWQHKSGGPRPKGQESRRQWDHCPTCPIPEDAS